MGTAVVKVTTGGLEKLSDRIKKLAISRRKSADEASKMLAIELRQEVQNQIKEQGLVDTGAYLDSIMIAGPFKQPSGDSSYFVITEAPQSLRLEFGYVGTDILGRDYADEEHPHWRPASVLVQGRAAEKYKRAIIGGVSE